MHVLAAILLCVSTTVAYQVIFPNNVVGWSTGGANFLAWDRGASDPSNFTAFLTNPDRSVMPVDNLVLGAYVDGSVNIVQCAPPAGGWPVGQNFRVNFAVDDEHPTEVLAQSQVFIIVQSPPGATDTGVATAVSTLGATTTTESDGTPSTSTPTPTGAALRVGTDGLFAMIAMLAAVFATAI